ncbi:MAG: LacI family DNA-binding transcriptional regulator [Chloroflexi bacterium]|nr:LacI family DNA-binding transcriptional regulator [Chloroflexota bacterium]
MTHKVTLREVADAAGVSVASASLALNNKPGVSEETRARILRLAAELGYQQTIRVDVTTASAATRVACLVQQSYGDDSMSYDYFYNQVLAGAEQITGQSEIDMTIYPFEGNENSRFVRLYQPINPEPFDAYMIVGTQFHYEQLADVINSGKPVVLVDSYAGDLRFNQILPDNYDGGYQAGRHLVRQGHRCIGVIGYQPGCFPGIRERYQGFQQALADNGIVHHCVEHDALFMKASRAAALRLLRRHPDITAIFALNDPAAFGVYQAAHELKLRIPDDLSIIGFDDLHMAGIISPPLTTIQIDKLLMGRIAMEHLQRQISQPDQTTITIRIHVRLIERGSVAQPDAEKSMSQKEG